MFQIKPKPCKTFSGDFYYGYVESSDQDQLKNAETEEK